MASERQRVTVDPALWDAAEAVAKAQRVHVSTIVERALRTYLDPFQTIHMAADLVRQTMVSQAETRDLIRVVVDTIQGGDVPPGYNEMGG